MAVIDPVVPALAGCLTTALVTVCGEHPGDQYIWREIARHRDRAEKWNDAPGRTKAGVLRALRAFREPDEAEMEAVFGPQWLQIRDVVRRAAVLTEDEAKRLVAARAGHSEPRRIEAGRLSRAAWQFAADLGLEHVLEREYGERA